MSPENRERQGIGRDVELSGEFPAWILYSEMFLEGTIVDTRDTRPDHAIDLSTTEYWSELREI